MSVTATNFQDPPHSAWGFHHVAELLPTATVAHGAAPRALPRGEAGIGAVAVPLRDGGAPTVAELCALPHVDGLAVLCRGVLVFEHYGNGMAPADPHILMSTTKSFAGSLAGVLVAEGLLDETADVTDLLPELAGGAYEGATVRHLLDMRVGLDFSEDYDDPRCDFAYMDAAAGWRPAIEPGAPDSLLAFLGTMRGRPPHGGPFHYVSPNAVVLGWVLEAVSGQSFAALLSDRIWRPMGAEFDALLVLDREGRSQTEGGLCVTLRDLARFGELHRLGGAIGGRRVIPAAWIADIRENGDPDAWNTGSMADVTRDQHYRSMWYTDRTNPRRPFYTAGAFGQSVVVDPDAETVVASLNCFPPDDESLYETMFRLARAVCDHLHGG